MSSAQEPNQKLVCIAHTELAPYFSIELYCTITYIILVRIANFENVLSVDKFKNVKQVLTYNIGSVFDNSTGYNTPRYGYYYLYYNSYYYRLLYSCIIVHTIFSYLLDLILHSLGTYLENQFHSKTVVLDENINYVDISYRR